MDKASSLHTDITTRLTPISDTPALEASVLLAHVLNKPRTWVIAHPELTLTSAQQKQLDDALVRLQGGEPLPYVLGHWEFFGLEFDINSDVLIPRPETELLVEKAIAWLKQSSEKKTLADIGTGSGAIAISIAVHVPDVNILATDISSKALHIAKQNAEKHRVRKRIEFVECDLLPEKSLIENRQHLHLVHTCPGCKCGGVQVSKIDLFCANLPYIPTNVLHNLPVYNREPTLALDGGHDGLDQIQKLMKIAPVNLSKEGLILLEIESSQGVKALSLAREAFPNAHLDLHQDLAGRDRFLSVNLSRINI